MIDSIHFDRLIAIAFLTLLTSNVECSSDFSQWRARQGKLSCLKKLHNNQLGRQVRKKKVLIPSPIKPSLTKE